MFELGFFVAFFAVLAVVVTVELFSQKKVLSFFLRGVAATAFAPFVFASFVLRGRFAFVPERPTQNQVAVFSTGVAFCATFLLGAFIQLIQ